MVQKHDLHMWTTCTCIPNIILCHYDHVHVVHMYNQIHVLSIGGPAVWQSQTRIHGKGVGVLVTKFDMYMWLISGRWWLNYYLCWILCSNYLVHNALTIVLNIVRYCLLICQSLFPPPPFSLSLYSGVYKVDIEAVLITGCSYFGQQTNKEVIFMYV